MNRLFEITDQHLYLESLHTFVRAAIATALTDDAEEARALMRQRWPETARKAAVGGGTTSSWGSPLVDWNNASTAFVTEVANRSILGRLAGAVSIPLGLKFPHGLGQAAVGWVGGGKPAPVSALAFETLLAADTKLFAIIPASKTLLQANAPEAEAILREMLVRSAASALDTAFIDPANTGTPGVKPAAITAGATTVASSGSTAAAVAADLQQLVQAVATPELLAPVFVTTPVAGAWLGGLQLPNGGLAFPRAGALGGELLGVPLVTSGAVPAEVVDTNGRFATSISLIDAGRIGLNINGAVVDRTEQAAIEMESEPTQDATTGGGATMVSLYQTNMVAIRIRQRAAWLRLDDTAAAMLTDLVLA